MTNLGVGGRWRLRRERCVVLPFALVLTTFGATPLGCSRGSFPTKLPGAVEPDRQVPLQGPLAALPAEVKASDFRVTPPKVNRLLARRAADGKAIVEVEFSPDRRLEGRRIVSLYPDGRRLDLRDDGREGDERADDHIFSLHTDESFEVLRADQGRLRGAISSGADRIPILIPTPLDIKRSKSLTITAPSVVEDPTRTGNPCTGVGAPLGKWSFGHLLSEMAGTQDPALFTEAFFDLFDTGGTAPNGVKTFNEANSVKKVILNPWPRHSNGHLDLSAAPLKLLAIVNRIDLAGNPAYGPVGGAEGRFVFEVMDRTKPGCPPLGVTGKFAPGPFLIIIEYGVPVTSCAGLAAWAERWIQLGEHPLGSSAYRDALAALTDSFTGKNADPLKPNGSALDHIRVNEIPIAGQWTLTQFHLTPSGLAIDNVSQTPGAQFDSLPIDEVQGGTAFMQWVRANSASILAHTQTVPASLNNVPILGAGIIDARGENSLIPNFWKLEPISNNDVRHAFSLDTCNGCHGLDTGTLFTQIGDHTAGTPIGSEAKLSGFLTGETIPDPVAGTPLTFAELERRAGVLVGIATSSCAVNGPARPTIPTPVPFHLPLPPVEFQPLLSVH